MSNGDRPASEVFARPIDENRVPEREEKNAEQEARLASPYGNLSSKEIKTLLSNQQIKYMLRHPGGYLGVETQQHKAKKKKNEQGVGFDGGGFRTDINQLTYYYLSDRSICPHATERLLSWQLAGELYPCSVRTR